MTQIVTNEQLSKSQELQKIRDFCQKNNKTSLNQQELNNIFKDELSSLKEPDSKNNNLLLIGGGLSAIFLIITVGISFVLFKKKKNKYKK